MATESLQAESVNALIESIDNNINYFDKSTKSVALSTNLRQLKSALEKSARAVGEIEKFAGEYDFDETTPGNGYRSFQDLQISAVNTSLKVCQRLINNREKMFFRAENNYAKEFDEWTQIFDNLGIICESLINVHECDDDRNLFVDSSGYDSILTQTVAAINPKAFYGETMGFQFCPSMRPILKVIVASMASYYSFFFKDNSKPAKMFNLPNSFLKYLINPNKRAAKYLHATENSTTEFCQSFWNLTEKRIAQTIPSMLAASKVEVNKVFKLHPKPLQIENNSGHLVDIPLPKSHIGSAPIECRLMSAKKLKGMFGVKTKPTHGELSKYLVFHCHGGGWASQTSKSHEIYMRDWAVKLGAPIFSIDYSLAPSAPFPRACEEIFYAYCWVLKNSEFVGSTGENIIFVGDSAGGNLVTSCLVQCIEKDIPKPKGIFNIYAPQWLGFIMSPSRFLSIVDPVLPFGFTTRLSKSYCEKHETVDENDNKVESQTVTTKYETSKRRIIYESYEQEFDIEVHDSYLVSPYLAPDEILKQFPPTVMLSTNLDPCLDDGIQMAKRLKKLNVDVQVEVLNGLSHGFLYFSQISKECYEGSMVCVEKMKKLLEM